MQKIISLRLKPSEAGDDTIIRSFISQAAGTALQNIHGYHILNRSLDARGRQAWVNLKLNVFVNEPFQPRPVFELMLQQVNADSPKVIIAGAGPAGFICRIETN
jgi:uncharacterized protein